MTLAHAVISISAVQLDISPFGVCTVIVRAQQHDPGWFCWEALLLDPLMPGPFGPWQGAGTHQSLRSMEKDQKIRQRIWLFCNF